MREHNTAQDILRHVYGYESFRGFQLEVIDRLVGGGDAVVLMPTGGGKSICYQIPSLLRPGMGLVISPLIALMEDQVQALCQLGIRSAYLNSSLGAEDARRVLSSMRTGEIDILYLAPERIIMPGTLAMLKELPIAVIAIDEAHCVSHWGHDFRPDYRKLEILADEFPNIPRIALTATADGPTRADIIKLLKLESARVFVSSFDRPNITYSVSIKDKPLQQLLRQIRTKHENESGIVYCQTRKKTEELALSLQKEGLPAVCYHAGLSSTQRRSNQERFIKEEGIIIVATVAFGMGIDKPNVRFVAHLDLPKSVEAYYQETGRAGRDGLPATAWMAYGLGDIAGMRRLIDSGDAEPERKRLEHQKLSALLGFAETSECRRSVLLRYFGEHRESCCDNCDNCLQPVVTWDGTLEAQQALSCIYRTNQRFGVAYLTDILRGVENERVLGFRHQKLSTFAIGKSKSAREWTSIFRQLVAMGYAEVDYEGGGLRLTDQSRKALRGEVSLRFRKDLLVSSADKKQNVREVSASATKDLDTQGQSMFEKLRQKRLELAKAANLPPYIIFHDKTLKEIARIQPVSLQQLSHIQGVGEQKLKRYGSAFLEVIAAG